MKQFTLKHRKIELSILCEDSYESIIKAHFLNSTEIINNRKEMPTYTLYVLNCVHNCSGNCFQMIDEVFDDAFLNCWIDNDRQICTISNFKASTLENKHLLIQYFCSNLFNRLLELNGYIGVHSSCVEKEGAGILFIGDRMAGKTTCMLNFLDKGFNLINNDIAAVKFYVSENRYDAFGIPNFAFIRLGKRFSQWSYSYKYNQKAAEQQINLEEAEQLDDNRLMLTHNQIARLNHVELLPSCSLAMIVIPKYNSEAKQIRIRKIESDWEFLNLIMRQNIELVHDSTEFLYTLRIPEEISVTIANGLAPFVKLPRIICEYSEKCELDFFNSICAMLAKITYS